MSLEIDISWDRLIKKKTFKYYPKNLKELNLIIKQKINKDNFVIKTGKNSYFDKSMGPGKHTINLKKFNKITLNKKKLFIEVGSGMLLEKLVRYLSKKKLTLHTLPGSANASIGGAISANVIGKSSSKEYACFGDSILSLKILTKDGKIKEVKETITKYIGAYGTYGIILSAKLKLLELKSKNLIVDKKNITSFLHLKKLFDEKYIYKYSIINPFLTKNSLGIFIGAKPILNEKVDETKTHWNKFLTILLLKIFSIFYFKLFIKIFYKIFFSIISLESKSKSFNNFHYGSNLYDYLPYSFREGLVEVEILIKDINFLNKVKKFFYDNDIFPRYIILKKQYKSKNNYFYEFSDNGYSVAMTFDNILVKKNLNKFFLFYKTLEKNKIKINITKNSLFKKSLKDYKKFKSYSHYNFKSYLQSKEVFK